MSQSGRLNTNIHPPFSVVQSLSDSAGLLTYPDITNNIQLLGGNNITTDAGISQIVIDLTGTTENAVQIGNVFGSLTSLALATDGQVLLGTTAGAPSFVSPTAGVGLTIVTNAAILQYGLQVPVIVPNGGTGLINIPANSIMIGNGAAAVNTIAVPGVAGYALVSQAGALPPVYGQVSVIGGGTGLAAFAVPYSVVCGGITTTSPLQQVAALGIAGQVLTSQGAASLPHWTTPVSPVLTYTPVNASPYVVLVTDQYISVDCSGGAISIQLPNAATLGKIFIIKDRTGSAAAHSITVTTVGGAVNIDGAATYVMNTAYEAIEVVGNGATYEVF